MTCTLELAPYLQQSSRWPKNGRHIMAQYDDESVVVYQAYKPSIGRFAAEHGFFGGEFKLGRMTWIKPNFLWMMYRSAWGTREGQEVTLAVRLRRDAFDSILASATASSFRASHHTSEPDWRSELETSDVRLQWDPDHDPTGRRLERRAIQLGLRRTTAEAFSREWLVSVEDVSGLVAEQRAYSHEDKWRDLVTPVENPYPVDAPEVRRRLGL